MMDIVPTEGAAPSVRDLDVRASERAAGKIKTTLQA